MPEEVHYTFCLILVSCSSARTKDIPDARPSSSSPPAEPMLSSKTTQQLAKVLSHLLLKTTLV